MREILFRGKTPSGEWAEGFYTLYANNRGVHPCILTGTEQGCVIPAFVIPETVGQYTGLTDKNGKKIFEGDIVTGLFLFGLPVKAVVTFQDGAFGLEWYRGGDLRAFNAFTSICNVEYEVIGNVHDNPELLKGE